jgi:nucleotide-binding universal stress UspA family protein
MAPVNKILLPTDIGRESDQIVAYAIGLAAQLGAQLLFFAVLDSATVLKMIERHSSVRRAAAEVEAEAGSGGQAERQAQRQEDEGFRKKLLQEARRTIQELVDSAAEKGVDALGHAVISEDTKAEILREAQERHADLILLGLDEAPKLWKLFFSETHDRLLQDAPCPVLTIRSLPWHRS